MSTRPTWERGYPATSVEVDALPYRPDWGHWGITAWSKPEPGERTRKLAEVTFPIGGTGPYDPIEVKRERFAELHAAAVAALGETSR